MNTNKAEFLISWTYYSLKLFSLIIYVKITQKLLQIRNNIYKLSQGFAFWCPVYNMRNIDVCMFSCI